MHHVQACKAESNTELLQAEIQRYILAASLVPQASVTTVSEVYLWAAEGLMLSAFHDPAAKFLYTSAETSAV